jgi:hypothetical protein
MRNQIFARARARSEDHPMAEPAPSTIAELAGRVRRPLALKAAMAAFRALNFCAKFSTRERGAVVGSLQQLSETPIPGHN